MGQKALKIHSWVGLIGLTPFDPHLTPKMAVFWL